MITKNYENIWDCCCDHGQLGVALLQRHAANKIHFVDIVEPLITALEQKLLRFYSEDPYKDRWQTHCKNIVDLTLNKKIEDKPDLIIIAGVGADQTIEFVQRILSNNPDSRLEFLLCPVLNLFQVRRALIDLELGLIDEEIILENRRFYEAILVSVDSREQISPVGSLMWNFDNPEHIAYLDNTISHYQRKAHDKSQSINEIIGAYTKLKHSK